MNIDELDISNSSVAEISQKLHKNDYIYISGGNTFFLLQELKRTGSDEIIKSLVEKGKHYIGESAGTIILSKNIEYIKSMDDYQNTILNDLSGLSLLDFYPLPHFGNFPFEDITKNIIEEYKNKLEIVPFSNSEIIIVNNLESKRIN